MSRKFSEARRGAFVRAVAATGNQTIAAERAKVSRSWVQLHRSTDPAFDAAVRAAIAEARARLTSGPHPASPARGRGAGTARPAAAARGGGGGSNGPPAGWGSLAGEELVVKGIGGSGARVGQAGRRVQIARARLRQWTPRAEARFLQTLAATCNVKAACAEVGLTPASAYAHRERWPGFARRWDEALDAGCVALEAALLEAACNPFSAADAPLPGAEEGGDAGAGPGGTPRIAAMDAQQALHLLYMHKRYEPRRGRLPGRPPSAAPPGQVAASIERALAKLARRKARAAARARRG